MNFFTSNSILSIQEEYRHEFLQQLTLSNLRRARILAHFNIWLTLISVLFLEVLNIYNLDFKALLGFYCIHFFMILGSVIFFIRYPKPITNISNISAIDSTLSFGLLYFLTTLISLLVIASGQNSKIIDIPQFTGLVALELVGLSTLFYHVYVRGWFFWQVVLFGVNSWYAFSTFEQFIQVATPVLFGLYLSYIACKNSYASRVNLFKNEIRLREEIQSHKDTNTELEISLQQIVNLYEELHQKNNELEKLLNEKKVFFGVATHDLRNPLSAIQMRSEMILRYWDKMDKSELQSELHSIESATKRMNEIINKFLIYNSLEQNQQQFSQEIIDVEMVINEIIQEMRLIAHNKLSYIEFSKTTPKIFITGDKSAFHEIIENLLSNAIKYSPFESTVSIILSSEMTANNLECVCTISDQGQGIPQDEVHLLFKPFQKLSSKPTNGESSIGLGLSIVKKLTEEIFHGSIHFENNKSGVGAQFSIHIPQTTII